MIVVTVIVVLFLLALQGAAVYYFATGDIRIATFLVLWAILLELHIQRWRGK